MRITASKKSIEEIREDIARRRKEHHDQGRLAYKARNDAGRNYRAASNAVIQPVIDELYSKFATWETMNPTIRGEEDWEDVGTARYRISINVENRQPEGLALKWSYEVGFDSNGNIRKTTSSWSGLEATTEANIHSLEQIVEALKYLNSLDWATLLDKQVPSYKDFYKDLPKAPAPHDFDQELAEAELSDMIGKNRLIRVKPWGESCPYRKEVYIRIVRETPSQYIINIVPSYIALGDEEQRSKIQSYLGDDRYSVYRVRKTSIVPVQPVDVIDIPEVSE